MPIASDHSTYRPGPGSVDDGQAGARLRGQRLLPFYHVELEGSDTIVHADAAYGVTDRLAVTASIPLLGVRSYDHIHYPPAPDPAAPVDDEHGHGGTTPAGPRILHLGTEGNGDALLGLRYALLASPRQRIVGRDGRRDSVYAFYQRPVYRHVNEYQLASRGALMMGVSRAF